MNKLIFNSIINTELAKSCLPPSFFPYTEYPPRITLGNMLNLEQLRSDRGLIEFSQSNLLLLIQNNPWLINYKNPPSLIIPGRTFHKQILNFIYSGQMPRDSLLKEPSVGELVKSTLKYHGLGEWFMKMLRDTKSIISGGFMLYIIIKKLLRIKTCNIRTNKIPPYGDIDIFMTDIKQIIHIETIFKNKRVHYEAIRSENAITIILKTNKTRCVIQFILATVEPASFLYTFDIPICSAMFYRDKVIITKEAVFELMHGIHVNSQKKTLNYMNRLVKYSMGENKKNGKGIKLIFPYYLPLNTTLTGYSFNDFWRSVCGNKRSYSLTLYYDENKYSNSILNNIMLMNKNSVISTGSFCLDGKSKLYINFLNETKVRGDLIEYIDKLFAKLHYIKHLDIGEIDWSKTIYALKKKNMISGDLYNGNDLRIYLKKYPPELANIIINYIGDTIIRF